MQKIMPQHQRDDYHDETSSSESGCARDEERTIPFLRRLVDMLQENDDVISFSSGFEEDGQTKFGQIVVHDRTRMESDVLPRYFNHSSFASLRRQLNYFSFTRVGKGRQRGATYSNSSVVGLDDILRLKRRTSVGHGPSQHNNATSPPSTPVVVAAPIVPSQTKKHNDVLKRGRRKVSIDDNDAVSSAPPMKKARPSSEPAPISTPINAIRSKLVSPQFSPQRTGEKRIALDLTIPSPKRCGGHFGSRTVNGDDDILAGCNALLNFSRGLSAM